MYVKSHSKRLWFAGRYCSWGISMVLSFFFSAAVIAAFMTSDPTHGSNAISVPVDSRAGGEATIDVANRHAFGKSLPTLPVARLREFAFGNRLFNTQWVAAPASVETLDGLGPVFNRSSCSGCHTRDGRGRPPQSPEQAMTSMLIRLSLPGKSEYGGPLPHPNYGDQLNDRAILGVPAEGRMSISYEEIEGQYGDGTTYRLRKPTYEFENMSFGPLEESVQFSPRVAPAVFGLGLLEAVDEQTIRSRVDPDDRDNDGISGRANLVWDVEKQEKSLGRFGWKANQPTLRQQIAAAFNGDIGITSSLFPDENVAKGQAAAAKAPNGGQPELSDEFLDRIVFYNRSLAVPARRNVDDPQVKRGAGLFVDIGCAACHTPTMTTGEVPDMPALSNQRIQPFTDLLLHDMGEELADNRPDFEADGREWRTPPLWGLGLIDVVNGHTFLLHDGRARNIEEAILWHGGEGEDSREKFRQLSAKDRAALLAFLESL